jgi:Ca2+-binding RTX toxin-like protein
MAVYNFSALADGQAITFDANADDLVFDQATISAAQLSFTQEGANVRVAVLNGAGAGKDVLLNGVSVQQLAQANVQFANGSAIRFGDNAVALNDDNANSLAGTGFADLVYGFGGNDSIQGNAGADVIVGGAGNDLIGGNNDNDTLEGNAGNDSLGGGGGQDTFLFREAGAANADQLTDFSTNWDRIFVDATAFSEAGAAGRLAAGDDRFHAAAGATGGADAEDRFVYNTTTRQLFYDADGNGAGAAQLVATVRVGGSLTATDITVLAATTPPGTINGTPGNDSITGTPANETINGLAGDDTIHGGGGRDFLSGGDGNDLLFGSPSSDDQRDTLDGGLGNDFYELGFGDQTSTDVVLVDAGGIDTVRATDWTLGAGFENLVLATNFSQSTTGIGNELANHITAGDNSNHTNRLEGRGGDDTLLGMSGSDTLLGGDGNDYLETGDQGNEDNRLDGGAGNDTLVASDDGGALNVFAFSVAPGAANADVIRGFASFPGAHTIELDGAVFTDIGPSGRFSEGDSRFRLGAQALDSDDRVLYESTTGRLFYDADGVGGAAAQLFATLEGAPAIDATSFEVINGTAGGATINGTSGNDSLAGGAGNDTINGFAGNDTLDGQGGADSLVGGAGNDLYFVDNAGDTIVEAENAGIDEVRSAVQSYTLAPWVNNLTLTNNAYEFVLGAGNDIDNVISAAALSTLTQLDGFGGNDTLLGGSGADELNGGLGNDSMVGGGGDDLFDAFNHPQEGVDTMHGGAGNDSYFVSAGDVIVESSGVDTVFAMASWTLADGLENLTFHTGGDDHPLPSATGVGNALNNVIRAGVVTNATLDGKAGNDTLTGGDITDFVFSVSPGAANADTITSFLDDTIVLDGTVHANSGPSGAFAAGDGRFWAAAGANAGHDADDRVVYNTSTGQLWYDADGSGAGAAQLIATLQGAPSVAATNIEVINGTAPTNQTIIGTSGNDVLTGGAGNDFMQGGDGADTMNGGAGNDTMSGNNGVDRVAGGAGNDRVSGGSGQDFFVFAESGAANADTVTDFASNWDHLQFDSAGFAALGADGRFAAGDDRFHAAAGANGGADAEDRVVYNTSTGQLWYDADGSGGGAAQLVATLQAGATLAATDITIV